MSTYVMYCRKSSESEERQVLSIDSQVKELKELAGRLSLDVSEILTESQSAKYPGRPIFNEMMKKIYKGQIKGVICWKLDRLARNPIDGSALVWALDQGKLCEIASPHGTFRNNSNDKFLMQIEFGMAKKYVDDLSDNVKRGNRAKLERGWLPGKAPLGYQNNPSENAIVKDPDRFYLARKMWDSLLQGFSPSQIIKMANDKWGFRTKTHKRSGNKPLCLSVLYNMFNNPFYYGLITRKEGIFQGKHEPMITEDEYWKAQEILGRPGRPRPKHHRFAFTGLIRCGECGSMITAEEKYNQYGYHYAYYRCTKKAKVKICSQKYVELHDLESQILGYLNRIHIPKKLYEIAVDYLKAEHEEQKVKFLDQRKSLETAYRDSERKLENLNQMRMKDMIDDEEYLKEKRRLIDEKIRLQASLDNVNDGRETANELAKEAFAFAHEGVERFQKGTLEEKRTILQKLGSNLSLEGKKLFIQVEKPLLIIEEGLANIHKDIQPLEPSKFGWNKIENVFSLSMIPLWWAIVEDVRTFYEYNNRKKMKAESDLGHATVRPY